MTNQKQFIFTTTIPEATKVSSMVNYDEGFPTIKSHDHLNKQLLSQQDKLKILNLIYRNTYCHQTFQDIHLL